MSFRLSTVICLLSAACCWLCAAPSVSNVRFAQRKNSNIVDIAYDLVAATSVTVSVELSTDGGATWGIRPRAVTGDVGESQSAGTDKRILWDAGQDCGTLRAARCVLRVTADDGITLAPRTEPTRPTPQPTPQPQSSGSSEGMVRVPAGTFLMGSPTGEGSGDEHPQHTVYLDAFYIDKCEVTNREYKRFCDASGRTPPSDPGFAGMPNYFAACPDYPVVNVSWDDASAYATWVGKRLPTEAEWEKAARGTDGREYPWGNEEPDAGGFFRANWGQGGDTTVWKRDGFKNTSPVGSYERGKSSYGCYDMAGNVWEWCSDWYNDTYYGRSPDRNPQGPSSGSSRASRGGGWNNGADWLRCANRYGSEPAGRHVSLGFRCARSE